MPESVLLRYPCHLISTTYQALSHFQGDNTGSNPVGDANKTKGLEKIPSISCVRLRPLSLSLRFLILHANDHTHDPMLCLTLEFGRSLRIDIHCDRDICVAQQLLHGLDVFTICLEQTGVGVTERMQANPFLDSYSLSNWARQVLQDR
jgi:hypothetical protein